MIAASLTIALVCIGNLARAAEPKFQIASFTADVTTPIGHPLLGSLAPATTAIDDPLLATGLVLLGAGKPIVIVSVDWCEIRNEAYDRWQEVLAEAAGTTPERVLVHCIHQHDAPIIDAVAQRIAAERKVPIKIYDPDVHEKLLQGVASKLREGLKSPTPFTHIGAGKAKIEKLASTRRYVDASGVVQFNRSSASGGDPTKAKYPEGNIDPWLRTLSFWNGDEPVAAISVYAIHPMSYYRTGRATSDFPGIARGRRQAAMPKVMQLYCSGACGNVTTGKYNDGNRANRQLYADKLLRAMEEAWKTTERHPVDQIDYRIAKLKLTARDDADFTEEDLTRKLTSKKHESDPFRGLVGLAWRERTAAGHLIEMPAIDFGKANFVLMPGETYVEFQLLAQQMRPDVFVVVASYGEADAGYLAPDSAWKEKDGNVFDWCWNPGAEQIVTEGLREVLKAPQKSP